jgi:hypothetical protein
MLGAGQRIQGMLNQASNAKSSRLAAVRIGPAAYQVVHRMIARSLAPHCKDWLVAQAPPGRVVVAVPEPQEPLQVSY